MYLDHNATTALLPAARDAMAEAARLGGNPASLHALGRQARRRVDDAAIALLQLVGAPQGEVVFTGSGSEADALGLAGLARARRAAMGATTVVVSAIEHPAIEACAAQLAAEGFTVRCLGVDAGGRVRPGDLAALFAEVTPQAVAVVSVMLAHNETGVLQPVAELAALAAQGGVPMHTDAVQAAGKIPVDFAALGVTALSLAAHKLGGPRGIGALVMTKKTTLVPLWGGGGQQGGWRSGTPAVPLIAGFGVAAQAASAAVADPGHAAARAWRDAFEARLAARSPQSFVIAQASPRLPNTSLAGVRGVAATALVDGLSARGIMVSAGAACHAKTAVKSRVLAAMGVPNDDAVAAVRFSCGWNGSFESMDALLESIFQVIEDLREAA